VYIGRIETQTTRGRVTATNHTANESNSKGQYGGLDSAMSRIAIISILAVMLSSAADRDVRPIDSNHSQLIVRVEKAGFLSGLSHNHNISAPILEGKLETSVHPSVKFDVNAAAMKVMDRDVSDSDRSEMEKRMLGPEVLDVAHYPEIHFVSDSVKNIGSSRWQVHGLLTLHGQTKPIVLEAKLENGHYRGTARILQSDFGLTPVKAAGGTIRVKDELQVEYDIVVAGH
jgi:polyisoprenoid-binding protein YceI